MVSEVPFYINRIRVRRRRTESINIQIEWMLANISCIGFNIPFNTFLVWCLLVVEGMIITKWFCHTVISLHMHIDILPSHIILVPSKPVFALYMYHPFMSTAIEPGLPWFGANDLPLSYHAGCKWLRAVILYSITHHFS